MYDRLVWQLQKVLIYWDLPKRQRMVWKVKISSDCLVAWRESDQITSSWQESNSNLNNNSQCMQGSISEHTTHQRLHQQKTTPCRTPDRILRLQFTCVTRVQWWKFKKLPLGLMGFNFWCSIQIVRSEFHRNNTDTWLHLILHHRFRVVAV